MAGEYMVESVARAVRSARRRGLSLDQLAARAGVSHPHSPGIVETVTVIKGTVVVGVDATEQVLSAGMTGTFAADVPHSYRGQKPSGAEFIMTLHLPAVESTGGAG